jgi:transcriptional regulator with PAS, ATPase and Fis domain
VKWRKRLNQGAVFAVGGKIAISPSKAYCNVKEQRMSSTWEKTELPGKGMKVDPTDGTESLRIRVRHAAKQVESRIIREALEQHHWNRRRTAEALKISYRSLMYKMKNCQLREIAERQEN